MLYSGPNTHADHYNIEEVSKYRVIIINGDHYNTEEACKYRVIISI
jgi:hypothetical protein